MAARDWGNRKTTGKELLPRQQMGWTAKSTASVKSTQTEVSGKHEAFIWSTHTHTMFSQEEKCSPAQIWNMAFKQSHWIQDRLQSSEVAKRSLCLWTPPPPLTKRPFEKHAEFHDFPTRHHSLYWRDARSSGRLSTLDVTKCCTGL